MFRHLERNSIAYLVYIFSVYCPFSDRVGLPLHNILSSFLPVMYIVSAMSTSTLSNHVLLGLPTGLLPSTPSLPTTSNVSCDRLDFFTCHSVFHVNTTHPFNHLHLWRQVGLGVGSRNNNNFTNTGSIPSEFNVKLCNLTQECRIYIYINLIVTDITV